MKTVKNRDGKKNKRIQESVIETKLVPSLVCLVNVRDSLRIHPQLVSIFRDQEARGHGKEPAGTVLVFSKSFLSLLMRAEPSDVNMIERRNNGDVAVKLQ